MTTHFCASCGCPKLSYDNSSVNNGAGCGAKTRIVHLNYFLKLKEYLARRVDEVSLSLEWTTASKDGVL